MDEARVLCKTPFGRVCLRVRETDAQRVAVLREEIDPRAAIFAAKAFGVTRIVEVLPARAIDRLLPPGALVVPHDSIDLTVGRAATFFVGKGYGFLSQQHVFCPELRRAAIAALDEQPRVFARGTLAVLDDLDQPIDPRWGAQLAARSGVPAAYLAKELEVCYAPLCVIGGDLHEIEPAIDRVIAQIPVQRQCPCATAMQATRERGLIGDDWRTWIGVEDRAEHTA